MIYTDIIVLIVLFLLFVWNDEVKHNKYNEQVIVAAVVIMLAYILYLYV